jgi:hypothetical protein
VKDITSEPNTLEPGRRWIKSTLSLANGDCVEVAWLPDGRIGVRHSQDRAGPVRFTPSEWAAFIGGVENGEFAELSPPR